MVVTMNVVAEPFEKPDGEDEVMALAESRGWPTIRGLVGGGDDGLHWRRRIRWFTASQLREAKAFLSGVSQPVLDKSALWYCARGADCVSPHTDGKGGHTLTDWVELELAKTMARMFGVPFENSEPHKGDPPPHGLCGYCWFQLNGPFPIHMTPEVPTP